MRSSQASSLLRPITRNSVFARIPHRCARRAAERGNSFPPSATQASSFEQYRILTALVRHGFTAVHFCRRSATLPDRHRSARGDARERNRAQTDLHPAGKIRHSFSRRDSGRPVYRHRRRSAYSCRKTKDAIGISTAKSCRLRRDLISVLRMTVNIGSRFARSMDKDVPIPTAHTIRNCG